MISGEFIQSCFRTFKLRTVISHVGYDYFKSNPLKPYKSLVQSIQYIEIAMSCDFSK